MATPEHLPTDLPLALVDDLAPDDFGTVEGRLEAITDADDGIKMQVTDILYAEAIACVVPEKLVAKALGSSPRRVEVEGRIHYRRDGAPISIDVTDITILPEDSELPSASDVRGIMG